MKTSIIFLFLALSIITVNAGKLRGKTQQSGDNGMISFSLNGNGGTSMSSGVSNEFSFNPNAGVEVSWGNFGLGIDASSFNSLSDFDFDAYAAPLRNLDFLTITGTASSWRSTSFVFGPTLNIPLGISKPIPGVGIVVKRNRPGAAITLSLKGGLTMNETPDFTILNNSTRKTLASYTPTKDFKKNTLTVIPSIRLSYWLSQNIALSANVQYAMQTGQTAFTTGYKDLSNVNISTPISPDQFNKNTSSAQTISSTTVGPDKYLSVGAGLIISFGKKGINQAGIKKNEAESKAITQSGIKRTENETNTTPMVVPRTGKSKPKNGLNVLVFGNGQTDANGTPIIDGKIVRGTLFSDKVKNNSFVEVKITQSESGDIGSAITDDKGNFSIELNHDTLHTIALNGVEFGKIKLTERKGWDGSIKGNKKGITENGLKKNEAKVQGIIDNGRRISMNVTVPKQTQGATFGEKVNAGKINVEVVEDGCIILFPNDGLLVNTKKKSSKQLSSTQQKEFGERMNAGLHAAGGALAQGASLLGGALPGGAIISASVSQISAAGASSNAKMADKKKKKVWDSSRDDDCDGMMDLPDGEYEFEFIIEQKSPSGVKQTLQTQVMVVFTSISNVLKTKHDTAKNSINNVR